MGRKQALEVDDDIPKQQENLDPPRRITHVVNYSRRTHVF